MAKKISYYRNKADKLFQIWFRAKYPNCELCEKPSICGHHFFPKSSSSALRYEEENMIPVCVGCHLGFHSARASQFIGAIIKSRGQDWFDQLTRRRTKIMKVGVKYYKEIIEKYD